MYKNNPKLIKQFEQADKRGIKRGWFGRGRGGCVHMVNLPNLTALLVLAVVVVGEDEVANGVVKVRNTATREEEDVKRSELPAYLKALRS